MTKHRIALIAVIACCVAAVFGEAIANAAEAPASPEAAYASPGAPVSPETTNAAEEAPALSEPPVAEEAPAPAESPVSEEAPTPVINTPSEATSPASESNAMTPLATNCPEAGINPNVVCSWPEPHYQGTESYTNCEAEGNHVLKYVKLSAKSNCSNRAVIITYGIGV